VWYNEYNNSSDASTKYAHFGGFLHNNKIIGVIFMKGEYINLFSVLANFKTNEFIVSLKQEIPNAQISIDENGEQKANTIVEIIDMYNFILTLDNAKNLVDSLLKCLEELEKYQETSKNE